MADITTSLITTSVDAHEVSNASLEPEIQTTSVDAHEVSNASLEPEIQVQKLEKIIGKNGKQKNAPVYHCCFFCSKPMQKITRHWFACHKECDEVNEIWKMSKGKKELVKSFDKKTKAIYSKKIALLKYAGDNRYFRLFLLFFYIFLNVKHNESI